MSDPEIQWNDEPELPSEPGEAADVETPCGRLIGCAGTGKSYQLNKRLDEDHTYAHLTATTGIAAMNLGGSTVTLNATLGYFDTASMREAYIARRLERKLTEIKAEGFQRIAVEEYSMLESEQLDILYLSVDNLNKQQPNSPPLGILLVGDLAQLPPVSKNWCFYASHWPKFAANTEKLTKVWRQSNGPLLDALNALRAGDGQAARIYMEEAGTKWYERCDDDFTGTTLLPKNANVTRYNDLVLARHPGKAFEVRSNRWGLQRTEWGENKRTKEWGIPLKRTLKVGSHVMILANRKNPAPSKDFLYVNGDGGTILDYEECSDGSIYTITVELFRNKKIVQIDRVVRNIETATKPPGWPGGVERFEFNIYYPKLHRLERKYVLGQVDYLPIAPSYATTVHKSQSLTLDRVQIDFRDPFFGDPAMLYVAMSRCRTLEGLRLVGQREIFERRCAVAKEIIPWI